MNQPATDEQPRRRTGGRSARVRDAVLHAVLDTLAEHGPDAVTTNEIARRAGVHATSIQRRWGTRENLLLDALLAYSREQLPIPDAGSLHDDLVAFAGSLAEYLNTPIGQALSRTMAISDDDAALAAGRTEFWQARYAAATVIIDRATDRGELPAGTDPLLVIEMLIAPLHFRTLLTREPIDTALIKQIVDAVEHGFAQQV
ncbi:TetR/AcrR family transcriptional regulator [Mycobacterium sp. CBMA293]|uniref:TetR/AcrR family transcriptional regulator n=2 Tax=Mycolicibacterium TaxID=1866885 RepID=UPI00132A88AB|nr:MULTISPECIES: TetR/AcrR family transcriptional regulator [unclassified Mycolicibacterium]MUL47070.1 TetR/AcrR family transcriptional regulator [Mycolicibacterium sp. CBMA 360]MUL93330.1 TetR/AcrR family transcriptional regulator [Mycolicibacterium sp. CBMA 230]MUL58447.1 TetR/AcrR family transcriptional regulator [Mycolicibacterium sp. CBMA 335]MUL73905.1 TetR/AcrR family transcriptional regulator [Mycolicibacterium sp. CBMA 311]MUM10173.1 TetR/AcrR family transcriptional regulator [Mycolic